MSDNAVIGSQTLLRGLDLLEAVAAKPHTLTALSDHLGLSRSTTHRLASSLVQRGYLSTAPRAGYRLGAKLLALGSAAHEQIDLVNIARPIIAELSARVGDTVHLGILDGDQAQYLDKVPGSRRVAVSSRVGDRQALTTTGLGKALMLGHPEAYWIDRFRVEQGSDTNLPQFIHTMLEYQRAGYAFDLEENEDRIRCVAAPIYDSANQVVAAISISSAAQYMGEDRMIELASDVRDAATLIARAFGYRD